MYLFTPIIIINNPLKVYYLNKKYPITIKTRSTQIVQVCFLLKNQVLTDLIDYCL